MREAAYPQAVSHQAEHRKLASEAKRIIEGYRAGTYVLSVTLSMFLVEWLNHHIKQIDRQMVEHLKSRRAADRVGPPSR